MQSSQEHPGKEPREAMSSLDKARTYIGVAIVLGFVITIFAVTILQVLGVSLPEGISIADISTVYSGLTGAVIGYFFGRGRT